MAGDGGRIIHIVRQASEDRQRITVCVALSQLASQARRRKLDTILC